MYGLQIESSRAVCFQRIQHATIVHRVREKTLPPNKMLKNAQYITQFNETYTA